MKRILLLLSLLLVMSLALDGQNKLINDTFYFDNDVPLDYTIDLTLNDSIKNGYDLVEVLPYTPNFIYETLLTNNNAKIRITDSDTNSKSSIFRYTLRNKQTGVFDTALVYFYKNPISSTVYIGDANHDGVVNHTDLLPLGIKYRVSGSPRHAKDKNAAFIPVAAGNWPTASRNVNDKHADLNGDGIIDTLDIPVIHSYFGQTWKSPTTLTSAPSFYTLLSAKVDGDTIDMSDGKISLPVKIQNQLPISSYGISFTYSLKYRDPNSGADSAYRNSSSVTNFNLWNEKPLIFFRTQGDQHYISAVKTNGKDGNTDGYAGVIEIVVVDVILGLARSGDVGKMSINFSDVLLVDKDQFPIDISPRPYTFYIRKVSSGVQNSYLDQINIYPNHFESSFVIERASSKTIRYQICNQVGQIIQSGELNKVNTEFHHIEWPEGIYFLQLEGNPKTYKLHKK